MRKAGPWPGEDLLRVSILAPDVAEVAALKLPDEEKLVADLDKNLFVFVRSRRQ